MTVYVETQRIYVASLSDYNSGILHGVHIDLSEVDDIDEVWERINKMLAASPAFKQFPQGGPAEEWAIHDTEGFGTWNISEYESIASVFKAAKLIQEHGAAASEWLANDDSPLHDNETFEELEDYYHGCYSGTFDSEKDYAYHVVSELGLPGIGDARVNIGPEWNPKVVKVVDELESYLDWDALASWAVQDMTIVEIGGGEIAVFRSEP